MALKIAFTASDAPVAQTARAALVSRYGDVPEAEADIIVALGGDGFMLQTLHRTQALPARPCSDSELGACSSGGLLWRLHVYVLRAVIPAPRRTDTAGRYYWHRRDTAAARGDASSAWPAVNDCSVGFSSL